MKRASSVLLSCLLAAACSSAPKPILVDAPPREDAQVARDVPNNNADPGEAGDPNGPIPITANDPTWGSATAPVTIVELGDFQCRFCADASRTLEAVRKKYGPATLRIVWKSLPLRIHPEARAAADMSMAVFQARGNDAFWAFHDRAFTANGHLTREVALDALHAAGLTDQDLEAALARGSAQAKVQHDLDLASSLDAHATPSFFVNGTAIGGAHPFEDMVAIIDTELDAVKKLVAAGTPATRIYAQRVAENRKPKERVADPVVVEDTAIWKVPVGSSPVRGNANAPVTIVEFADFQCQFCANVEPTLNQIAAQYGPKVRLVFKHDPLTVHPRAEPAAQLALEARAQKGDKAFWAIHDALFASRSNLEDTTLAQIATQNGLNGTAALAAITSHKHQAALDEDLDLATDVKADGTPNFFINGRRLVGQQPFNKFAALIDDELKKADALIGAGTPANKVYDAIIASGKTIDPPKKIALPAPTKANPSRGPANAKVVIQLFADFQCRFCKAVEPTLADLEKAFPGKLRIVWHNLPIPALHPNAQIAAEAALEAFKQQGDKGFFAMRDRLFADQAALDRQGLEATARALKLDLKKLNLALDSHAHAAEITADLDLASAAHISATPTTVINGYVVDGAQPLQKFRRVVRRALAE